MSATVLPGDPVYAFVPVEDADTGFWQVRVLIDDMDIAIGTSLIVLGVDEARAVADRLNRPLGWTRETWSAFAARHPGAAASDPFPRAMPAMAAPCDPGPPISAAPPPGLAAGNGIPRPGRFAESEESV